MEDFSKYNGEGTNLRAAQLRMVEMLMAIDKVCRKHNIDYWLDFGSLLGVVRHKGFIPWDDDMDISIMKSDYNRLREALIADLPEQFVFQDSSTEPYFFSTYARVRDRKSYCFYPNFVKQKEQGLWIDICLYEEVASKPLKIFTDYIYRRTYRETHHFGDVAYKNFLERWTKKIIAYCLHPFSLALVAFNRLLSKNNKIGMMSRFECSNDFYYKKNIFPLKEMEFEGHQVKVPANPDAHLRGIYGDYMQIPPEEARPKHFNKVDFFD